MKTNATSTQIKKAVNTVSKRYGNNITFDRQPDPIPGTKLTRFTLKTKTANGLGSKGDTTQVSIAVTEEILRELFKINASAYVWNSIGKFVKGFNSMITEPKTLSKIQPKSVGHATTLVRFLKKHIKKEATRMPQFNELLNFISHQHQPTT